MQHIRYIESTEEKTFTIFHLKEYVGDKPTVEEVNSAEWFCSRELERDDPILIEVVKLLGTEANGKFADLKIVEIPDGTDYVIEDYEGVEHVAEVHQTWY